MQVRAKKFLGQHFLNDLDIAFQISDGLLLDQKMPVLEIGPGTGVLTQFLVKNPMVDLTCVELDWDSAAYLREHYPDLKLWEADFLKLDLNDLFHGEDFCIIGNFPYNISSQIFFKALEYRDQMPQLVGMVQKEVAERVASKPGKKAYGILSVLMQAYFDFEYLFTVPPTVFTPPPKVQSAVVRFTRNNVKQLDCDERLFKTVVKTAFNQRRKTMRNSLKSLLEKESKIWENVVFNLRPEQLSVAQFVDLTNLISAAMSVFTES